MRRAIAIVLATILLVLGTGAVQYAHNHAHLAQDDPHAAVPADGRHHHDTDEADCLLHALMRGPMLSGAWVPLLVCLGLFVAFLTLLASQPAAQRFFSRLDCRGPPAPLLISA